MAYKERVTPQLSFPVSWARLKSTMYPLMAPLALNPGQGCSYNFTSSCTVPFNFSFKSLPIEFEKFQDNLVRVCYTVYNFCISWDKGKGKMGVYW